MDEEVGGAIYENSEGQRNVLQILSHILDTCSAFSTKTPDWFNVQDKVANFCEMLSGWDGSSKRPTAENEKVLENLVLERWEAETGHRQDFPT